MLDFIICLLRIGGIYFDTPVDNIEYLLKEKVKEVINDGRQKQNKETILKITNAIYHLPYGDVRKLAGYENYYRLRVGNYRVIFDNQNNIYMIEDIGNRGDIYKQW